jgi:hypothetical protein
MENAAYAVDTADQRAAFAEAVRKTNADHPVGAPVEVKSPEFYKANKLFLTRDRRCRSTSI